MQKHCFLPPVFRRVVQFKKITPSLHQQVRETRENGSLAQIKVMKIKFNG
jgi:hypothetical protein